ncbi:MAG TPA: adenylate/guanylate cyclase domain-containing protein [Roseiarcus sp.]|jgi:TolB-like protein/Tfp pilus assembly protein PilF|nr:adenylate/guanylate cyclase domain-containing protein [Roseiarcus sp.]
MTASRKLAAILAADVVGYSRMMGEDEAGTASLVLERREAAQPIIAAHGGRLFKTMGDGMFVEFPSVVAAVECALAMQRQMAASNEGALGAKRVVYRIGVHLGDVLVEGEDILGDGVNIASRIESVAEPGSVSVSGAAHEHVRGRIDAQFIDLGEKALKNIARPVRVYAVHVDAGPPGPALDAASSEVGPPRLSIIVLPFANIGGDSEQDYFVDGVTESLTTDLSRIRGSFVIARNTAFTYRGKAFDVTQIGRELNVRYALEGSAQRSGNRMRINAQLIDAQSGSHLWAERFERPVTDLFEMQDEIVARIANTLNAQLIAAEARRAERAPTPDSLDLYFQGEAWVNKGVTFENLSKARSFFERALALDPANVDALAGVSQVEANLAISVSTDDKAARFAAAEAAATRALSLAPDHALAHLSLGMVLGFTNRAAQGIAEYERALALDRNMAGAHSLIGQNKLFIGRAEETEAHVLEALRLSPRDPWAYIWLVTAGFAACLLGRDEEAASWFRRSIEANRNFALCHFIYGTVLANIGRMDEARSELAAGLALDPGFTIANFQSAVSSDNPVYLEQRARIIVDMRRAGVPEA